MECLDDNLASEFVSGQMQAAAQERVEAHLASCRDCRDLVAALAGPGDDSDLATAPRDKREGDSQAGKRPVLSIGDRVGRYLVLSTLGAGGMGMVFAAYDPQLDRKIALKVLRSMSTAGTNVAEARKRLKREAQAIARLNHPNVVGVYDVGTTGPGDDVYIAMEFVEGDTLTSWLKRYPRTWREILDVFGQAGRGLMAAHSVGLLHRDFKPDNVLVGGDGRVRVTDFGLARSVLGIDDAAQPSTDAAQLVQADLTATGTVLGTPRYMPPEQLQGPNIDARSDQFSFCVALYEALYGAHPLEGSTSVAMLDHGTEAHSPPDATRVPPKVGRAVMRGLAKERSLRFPAMAELMAELRPPEPRPRYFAAAALAIVLLGGATAAIALSRPPTQRAKAGDDPHVAELLGQIGSLEAQVKQLRQQVALGATTHDELERAHAELDAKEQQIRALTDEIARLRIAKVPPKAPPTQSELVTAAVATAQRDLEGCFDEWSSRPVNAEDVGNSQAPGHGGDSDLIVTLAVAPDGTTSGAAARGEDTERSPSLKFCIESALARIAYPQGKEALDLEVAVTWAAPDMVNTTARVVGHHMPAL